MNDRRRFLHVLGATTAAVALPACGGTDTTSGTGTSGAGGAGGSGTTSGGLGGAGGAGSTSATTGDTTSAAESSSASTGGGGCEMNPAGIAVGVPADFPTNGLHLVPGSKVLVGRDANGLYALTSLCTHQFCDMNGAVPPNPNQPAGTPTKNGITCNCHGSKFDTLGNVISPPPTEPNAMLKPLKAYAMALGCDGKLYVDKTKVVSITLRVIA